MAWSRERRHDLLPRLGGVVGFSLLLAHRLSLYAFYFSRVVWALEVLHPFLIVCAYVVRAPVRGRARGWAERYFPFLVPALTFALLYQPFRYPHLQAIASLFLSLGVGLECLAIWTLRHDFSIMVEARSVVTWGPYRYLRHPIYLGGALASFGALLLRVDAMPLALYLLFLAGTVMRARLEERKLHAHFPAYAEYQRHVPMFGVRLPTGMTHRES